MNMKKGDRVFVKTFRIGGTYGCFGYLDKIEGNKATVRVKLLSNGHLIGDKGDGIVDATDKFYEFDLKLIVPAKEHAEHAIKILAKRLHNMTDFL